MEAMSLDGVETIAAHVELVRMCSIVNACLGIEAHTVYNIWVCWCTEDDSSSLDVVI